MLTVLTSVQIFLGLFLILVFNSLKTQLKSERILFWYLLLLMFRTAVAFMDSTDAVLDKFPLIVFVNQPLYFLDAFFIFIFVRSIHRKKIFTSKTFIALIPFVLYSIYMVTLSFEVAGDQGFHDWVMETNKNRKNQLPRDLSADGYVYIFSIIIYNIWLFSYSLYQLKTYRRDQDQDNIVVNQLNVKWQRQLIIWWFLMVCLPVGVILFLISINTPIGFYELISPLCILILTFIFGLRKLKIKIDELRITNEEVTAISIVKETPKYGSLKLSKDRIQEINMEINTAMNTEKIYLEPEMNLTNFSEKFGEKPHFISQVINTIYGKSFQGFLNTHRIEFAKELLQNNPEYKIIHIAFDSGFKSKATFNLHFKNNTGMTPSEYKRKLMEALEMNPVTA